MRSHLVVGNHDLTDYIVENSYEVYTDDVGHSWEDGNGVEHMIVTTTKVKGQFKIVCSPDKMTLAQFLSIWNSAVVNHVVTLGLYVVTTDTFESLECYYEMKPSQHIKSTGGKLYDVLEITIRQR